MNYSWMIIQVLKIIRVISFADYMMEFTFDNHLRINICYYQYWKFWNTEALTLIIKYYKKSNINTEYYKKSNINTEITR